MNRKERRLAYATALNSAASNITVIPDFQVQLLLCLLLPVHPMTLLTSVCQALA